MPRGQASPFYSQLSVVIPRSIHRTARRKAIRSGAPSFAAYVAVLLDRAPDVLSAADLTHAYGLETLLKLNEANTTVRAQTPPTEGDRDVEASEERPEAQSKTNEPVPRTAAFKAGMPQPSTRHPPILGDG